MSSARTGPAAPARKGLAGAAGSDRSLPALQDRNATPFLQSALGLYPRSTWRHCATGGLLLLLVTGGVLRLIWPEVMEFKRDEIYVFERCMNAGRREPMPRVGLDCSAGPANPALSIW